MKLDAGNNEMNYLLFNNAAIPLLLINVNTSKIARVNKMASILFDEKEDEIFNKSINEFIISSEKKSFTNLLKNDKVLSSKIFFTNKGIPIIVKYTILTDGKTKYFQLVLLNYSSELLKDEKELKVKKKLEFLYSTAQQFLSLNYTDDIYEFVGKSIRELIPRSIVVTSYYDKENNAYVIQNISGIGKKLEAISKKIGINLIGHKVSVETKIRNESNYSRLINLDRFDEKLFLRKNQIYNTVRDFFVINSHYSVSIDNKNELLGNISIFTRNDKKIENPELIEIFAYQAGATIQKHNLQKQLIKSKEKAEESDKLKSAFLANMSHEIRTPMNTIIGFSEMLFKKDLKDEQREKYYKLVSESSTSLLNLIDDILDISKIESGQLSIIDTRFSPFLLLQELLFIFKKTLKLQQSNVKLSLKINSKIEDIEIVNDEFRLKQILNNLITNAIKFTTKGKIEFGYTIDNNILVFFVSDTGKGISKSRQKNVFKRFNQGEGIKVKGTGLGLAISKQLVQLMGGELWLESDIQKGSNFYFSMPLTKKEVNVKVVKRSLIKLNNWPNKVILIAEDEDNNYELLYELLIDTKVKLIRARNGLEAVEYCKKNTPDLVLMDIRMPIMDGFTATSKIMSINSKIKIIAQTAFAMAGEKEKAINVGCVDFVTKPLNKETLFFKINKCFN